MKYTTIALSPEVTNRVKVQLSKINQIRLEDGQKELTLKEYTTHLLDKAMESEETKNKPTA